MCNIPDEWKNSSRIDFSKLPTAKTLNKLDHFIGENPDVLVRFYSNYGDWTNLEWISAVPNLQRLQLTNSAINSPYTTFEPFRNASNLRELTIDGTASGRIDLSPLTELSQTLRSFSIGLDGRMSKIYRVIESFSELRFLGLASVDFSKIAHLKQLESLGIGAGKITSLEHASQLLRIKRIFLNGSKIESLTEILNYPKLDEALILRPSGLNATSLPKGSKTKLLHLHGMKSLRSLNELSTFSRLHTFVFNACKFPPEDFACLNKVPTLKKVYVDYRSEKKLTTLRNLLDSRISIIDSPVMSLKEDA